MTPRRSFDGSEQAWTPPDGLDRSRPRELRLIANGMVVLVVAAILGAAAPVVGIGLEYKARNDAARAAGLRDRGVAAEAEVTRLWRSRGDRRQPWMAYRYAANGRDYEGQAKLRLQEWNQLRVGTRVPLRHLRDEPQIHELQGRGTSPAVPGLSYAAALVLAVLALAVTQPLRRQRRLLSEGRAAPGRVTALRKEQHGHVYDFDFDLLTGAVRQGKAGPSHKPPAVGARICVLYDPDDPRRHATYPLSLVRLARTQPL
jgi:hypothetical protein